MVTGGAINTVIGMAALRVTVLPIPQGNVRTLGRTCTKVTVINNAWPHHSPHLRHKLLAFLQAARRLSAEPQRSEPQRLFRTTGPTTFIPIKAGIFTAKPNRVGSNAQREAGKARSHLHNSSTVVIRLENAAHNGPIVIVNPVRDPVVVGAEAEGAGDQKTGTCARFRSILAGQSALKPGFQANLQDAQS